MNLNKFFDLVEKAKQFNYGDYQWFEGLEDFTKAFGCGYSERLIEYAFRLGRGEKVIMPIVPIMEMMQGFDEFKELENKLIAALKEFDQFVFDFEKAFNIREECIKYMYKLHNDYKVKNVFPNGSITQ